MQVQPIQSVCVREGVGVMITCIAVAVNVNERGIEELKERRRHCRKQRRHMQAVADNQ